MIDNQSAASGCQIDKCLAFTVDAESTADYNHYLSPMHGTPLCGKQLR
jgi:hypothetical protein